MRYLSTNVNIIVLQFFTHIYMLLSVCLQEWPEAVYPPYANGPGYVLSIDIARDIASRHANHSLRVRFTLNCNASVSALHLPLTPPSGDHLLAAVQDGGREHGNVGGGLQCHCTGAVHPQLEVLPVRLRG